MVLRRHRSQRRALSEERCWRIIGEIALALRPPSSQAELTPSKVAKKKTGGKYSFVEKESISQVSVTLVSGASRPCCTATSSR